MNRDRLRAIGTDLAGRLKEHHVTLSAAGVAFYGFVALVPAFAAVLAVYGLVSDPETAADQMDRLFDQLPEEVGAMLTQQVSAIAESSTGSLSVTLVVSVGLSLWAASSAMAQLVQAINMADNRSDDRSWLARRGLALLLTLGATVATVVALFVIAALPQLVGSWLPGGLGWLVAVAAWLVVGLGFVAALSLLYRIAPRQRQTDRRWITPGAVIGVATWAVASALFSFYVSNFGSYNETYGSLATVVVLLFWLYLSAFVVLAAGELDLAIERHP